MERTARRWVAVAVLGGAVALGGCAESMSGDGMSKGSGTMMQDKGAMPDKGMMPEKGATMEKRSPRPEEDTMAVTSTRISEIDRPGLTVRAFYKIGARMFGMVPTPERIMAHRVPLMLGMGGLWSSIEWSARLSRELRALLQLHVAQLSQAAY